VIQADPSNPHDLNRKYEEALRYLANKRGCKSVRVVYDALSDFLKFTDVILATQYLRHNMVWEEQSSIESLYLFRSGTIDEDLKEYFVWFANGVLQIKRSQANNRTYLECDFRGPFKQSLPFKLDFNYDFIND
jgi:hypothetical protein